MKANNCQRRAVFISYLWLPTREAGGEVRFTSRAAAFVAEPNTTGRGTGLVAIP